MNGLYLHTGNRLESLVKQLAVVTREPLPSPLLPEIVLVQSVGMSRWLTLQLARLTGVCMNCQFPFPRTFINQSLKERGLELSDRFTPEWMTWMIHAHLPSLLEHPAFAPVAHYARRQGAENDPLKIYQLSKRLANLFDQYLVYRPDVILEWESGKAAEGDAAWQAVLWRTLNPPENRQLHFAAAIKALAEMPADASTPAQRVSIFGISSLPPAQVEVFYHLAANRPVHLFLLSPSSEYFGDDLTPKQRAKRGLPAPKEGEGVNPLLTSLGRLNTHFREIILEESERLGHRLIDGAESYEPSEGNTLLMRLQRDLLHAVPPMREPFDPADDSIAIHVCHSEMREVEVLYDQLLTLFDNDPELRPRDVLVMAPNIEKYAPFIHAVFGNPELPELRIPYSIADRHPRSESVVIDTFLRILELPASRCTANQGFSLVQSAPIREKFQFSDDDLEQIRTWIDESGIRWGLNMAHRERLGVADFEENTWQHGLDRLLLGYAMPGQNRHLFEGILPHDDVEGTGAELLGRFASAIEAIIQTVDDLGKEHTLAEWPPVLEQMLPRFFDESRANEQEGQAIRHLRAAIARLAELAASTQPDQPVPFEVLREALQETFGEAEGRGRFLTGGVTFCALKPMRSIPAKVIWLLGMDDGAFPRQQHPVQFDLIAQKRRLGDRSSRDDDRYIFLEAIISARHKLRISTIGRSIRSNEAIPPSIVVSELLDYLEGTMEGANPREVLITQHRLHAFSPAYFNPPSSYSVANAAAANAALRPSTQLEPPFLSKPLDAPEPEYYQVTLEQLVDFLSNPAAYFLRHRLSLQFRSVDETLQDVESPGLDHLQSYQIQSELLASYDEQRRTPEARTFTARGILPPGTVGDQVIREVVSKALSFHQKVCQLRDGFGAKQPPFTIQRRIGAFHLSGTLTQIYGSTLFLCRHSGIKPKDRLRAWIQHLAYSCYQPEGITSYLYGTDGMIVYHPVEEPPDDLLAVLLTAYLEGLVRPLHFFPESALAYTQAVCKNHPDPLKEAVKAWDPEFKAGGREGEYDHPAYHLCFLRGTDESPLNEAFCENALKLLRPMLEASTEEKP